ncbi:MAG TPA: ABC transporter ATP-binding protein [Thermoanaerobaculia bacterium]|jgi:ABC-2 type transport system ATP-binding protein|nr:ABC transporter ATP-binding protein [Thermoanaerobaculia bacterium]
MIEAQNLTRRYGDFTAVHGISFSVNEGEIVGMLGPNGAGKTTTIRMITGFLPPTGGRVTVAGKDLFESPREARRQLGYLPENVALYGEMRVEEYLAYRARLEGLSRADAREAIGDAVERCLLTDVRHQLIGTLSKGYRQRVGLATAILHRPSTLVLDEPTVGLDPKQIIAIRELIRELGRQRTLLLSTHILPEVELLCNRVMIIDRGRIVAEGTPEELRERSVGNPAVRVTLKNAPDAAAILGSVPGVAAVHPGRSSGIEGGWLVEHTAGTDPREEIFRAAVARGWVLLEMARERTTLEDIFVRLTTHDQAGEAAAPEAPVEVSPALVDDGNDVDEKETAS